MASIRKVNSRSSPWLVNYRLGLQRKKKYFKTKAEAQLFRTQLELRPIDELTGFEDIQRTTLEDAISWYYEKHTKHKHPRNVSMESLWFTELHSFMSKRGVQLVTGVTRNDLMLLRDFWGRGRSASTVNRRMNTIQSFFSKCQFRGYITNNPMNGIEKLREDSAVRKIWSDEQIVAVIQEAPEWFRDCLRVLALTGARVSGVVGLKWSDVDFETDVIHIQTRKTRRSELKYYQVPMFDELRELLRKRKAGSKSELVFLNSAGNPLSASHASRLARGVIRKLGFDGLNLHGLRHTMITKAARTSGVHLARELAGHSSLTTTQGYVHVGVNESREALSKIVPIDFMRPSRALNE